eukprot:1502747-Prymnesium_polylepis.2
MGGGAAVGGEGMGLKRAPEMHMRAGARSTGVGEGMGEVQGARRAAATSLRWAWASRIGAVGVGDGAGQGACMQYSCCCARRRHPWPTSSPRHCERPLVWWSWFAGAPPTLRDAASLLREHRW